MVDKLEMLKWVEAMLREKGELTGPPSTTIAVDTNPMGMGYVIAMFPGSGKDGRKVTREELAEYAEKKRAEEEKARSGIVVP